MVMTYGYEVWLWGSSEEWHIERNEDDNFFNLTTSQAGSWVTPGPSSPSPTDSELVGIVPNPYVQNLRFGCASLADAYQESQILTSLLSEK